MDESDDLEAQFPTGGGLDVLATVGEQSDPFVGSEIRGYQITALIAEGGMGRVYRAARTDGQFAREAAIKILPSGVNDEYIKRFEQERNILADLNHPNIAQLYDAGISATGSLFLIMELVDGKPIDEYCRSCSTSEKVRLVYELCEALGFAHGKLILHRDIKPSNVLVTARGVVKLLDFGIAKMIESTDLETRGHSPMTPKFASPEQLLGEASSIASDVYQVGILLHLLLLERSPFESMDVRSRIEQISQQQGVPLIDTRDLDRDLLAVVAYSLSNDPDHRYRDINALAADLKRYMEGYPVQAAVPGLTHRVLKWGKRNRLAAGTAAVMSFMLIISSAWYVWSLDQARRLAEREAAVATQTRDLMVEVFQSANPLYAQGADIAVGDVLDTGLRRIRATAHQDPQTRLALTSALSLAYQNLGDMQQAEALWREIIDDGAAKLGAQHPSVLQARFQLANLRIVQGQYPAAEQLLMSLRSDIGGIDAEETLVARLHHGFSQVYARTGRYEQAIAEAKAGVDYATRHLGADSMFTFVLQNALSDFYNQAGKPDLAEALLEKAKPRADQVLGELHRVAIAMTVNLAGVYSQRFEFEKSGPLYQQVLERHTEIFGPDHPETIRDQINLGIQYLNTSRLDLAHAHLSEGVNRQLKVFGADHPMTARYRSNLAMLAVFREEWQQAIDICREIIPQQEHHHGKDHWFPMETRRFYGVALWESGLQEAATTELQSVLLDMRRVFGETFAYAVELQEYMQEQGIPLPNFS